MLVLTRKHSERLIVTTEHGEIIEILVVAVNKDRVRLGIEAPASVGVLREELLRKTQQGVATNE